MGTSGRSWWRRRRQEPEESGVDKGRTAQDRVGATAEEVEELRNEIAELRQQADELRQRLKDSEARLGTLEDDGDERARTIDTLFEWSQEQEAVLAKHRDVVAAMGAAARILEKDPPAGDLEAGPKDGQPST